MSHAAAEVGIRRGGLPSELLLGDDGELIWKSVSVCHGGPPLVGVLCESKHSRCRLRGGRSWETASNCHSRLVCGERWCDSGSILNILVLGSVGRRVWLEIKFVS